MWGPTTCIHSQSPIHPVSDSSIQSIKHSVHHLPVCRAPSRTSAPPHHHVVGRCRLSPPHTANKVESDDLWRQIQLILQIPWCLEGLVCVANQLELVEATDRRCTLGRRHSTCRRLRDWNAVLRSHCTSLLGVAGGGRWLAEEGGWTCRIDFWLAGGCGGWVLGRGRGLALVGLTHVTVPPLSLSSLCMQ